MIYETKTAIEIAAMCRSGQCSVLDVIRHFLKRVEESKLNSVVSVHRELAEKAAKSMDDSFDKSSVVNKPLYGVPILNKAIFCINGVETNACSKILQGFRPSYTATIIRRLNDAGAIVIGTTNTDEFAMGWKTNSPLYGQTIHPLTTNINDPHIVGGSSGGSGAAIAERLAFIATSSDTGGSTRQPASLCGLFGVKPSYGALSRNGMIAFANSFDHPGIITQNLLDSAIGLQAMMGHDEFDPTSSRARVPNLIESCRNTPKKQKFAIIKTIDQPKYIEDQIRKISEQLKLDGHTADEIFIPEMEQASDIYPVLTYTEAMSNTCRYDMIRYGKCENYQNLQSLYSIRREMLGTEVRRRIAIGKYIVSKDNSDLYLRACATKRKISQQAKRIFSTYDCAIAPSGYVGTKPHSMIKDEDYNYFDIMLIFANAAGIPSISIPVLEDENSMPIGLQVMSGNFEEAKMYGAASTICKIAKIKDIGRDFKIFD